MRLFIRMLSELLMDRTNIYTPTFAVACLKALSLMTPPTCPIAGRSQPDASQAGSFLSSYLRRRLHRLLSAAPGLPPTHHRLPPTAYRLPPAVYRLSPIPPTNYRLLPTAYRLPPPSTAYPPALTTHRPPPSAYPPPCPAYRPPIPPTTTAHRAAQRPRQRRGVQCALCRPPFPPPWDVCHRSALPRRWRRWRRSRPVDPWAMEAGRCRCRWGGGGE